MSDLTRNLSAMWQSMGDKAATLSVQLIKACLNGGEISPGMGSRFDQPRYQTGAHELLNFVPLPCGGVTRRPGFERMGEAQGPTRLEAFIFSQSQARVLEFYARDGFVRLAVWGAERFETGLALPLPASSLDEFTLCQSNDVIFLAHPSIRPGKIMRFADDDWRYEQIWWLPSIAAPAILSASCAGEAPENEKRRVSLTWCVTAVSSETGEESLPSEAAALSGQYPLSDSWYGELKISPQPDVLEFRVYKRSAGVFGFIGRITEADEEGEYVFRDENITPDLEDTPPAGRDPFEDDNEHPAVVFLHQQRLGYAATPGHPLTVWLSQAGNLESMAASTPPEKDDAIEATLAAPQANAIVWAMSDRTGLALGTEGGEWLLQASEGSALTPQDATFQPQTSHGSQPGLQPVRAGDAIIFVQRGGSVVREFGYSFQDDRYTSTDLGLLARHILKDAPIASWCWQPEPHGIIWCALKNGAMAALTYLREHEIIAWHRHETAGQIKSVTAIPAPSGNHEVWAAVQRQDNLYIERLKDFDDQDISDNGDPFTSVFTPTLPETSLEAGSTYTRLRKLNALTAHVINSQGFDVRAWGIRQSGEIAPGPSQKAGGSEIVTMAHWHTPLQSGWLNAPALTISTSSTAPLTILGISISMEIANETGA